MKSREEIVKSPDYLLQDAQLEIYAQVKEYMTVNHMNRTQFASKLNYSKGYISQILNGNLNCTLKKLIELSLAIERIPKVTYTPIDGNHMYTKDIVLEFKQSINKVPQTLSVAYKNDGQEVTAA